MILVISILTIIISIIQSHVDHRFRYLFLIPTSFVAACIINRKIFNYIFNNLVVLIVFFTYFIRNVIAIYAYSISNYSAMLNDFTVFSVNKAIFIITIDTLLIMALLKYEVHKKKFHGSESVNYCNFNKYENSRLYNFTIFAIVLFILFSWFYVPELKNNFTTIFDNSFGVFSTVQLNIVVSRGTISRLFLTLALLLIKIFRVIIPVYLLKWIVTNIKFSFFRLLLIFSLMFLQLLLISGNTMDSIISIFVIFIVSLKIDSKNRKSIMLFGFFSGLLLLSILVYYKMLYYSSGNSVLSIFLQSYFPGVSNLASVFNINTNISKIHTLLADFYTMVPFRNSLFRLKFLSNTAGIFNYSNNVRGQIIPFIGESYYYFGYFSFLIPLLIIKAAFYYYDKAKKSFNIFEYTSYIYITVYFSISPVLYHNTILGAFFLGTAVPLLIINNYNKYRLIISK